MDYLVGKDGKPASYNDDFRLRGVKQYWLKKEPEPDGELGRNKKVASVLKTFDKGVRFCGEIRFSNLTDEELGMLLWGLLLEKDSQQNIGKGKPYGYGRISVKLLNLEILNNENLYDGANLCLQPYTEEKGKAGFYIKAAKEDMTRFLGRDIMKVPQIRDFFLMKDSKKIPDNEATRYMTIANREFQNRERKQEMLPSIDKVIKETPAKEGTMAGLFKNIKL